MNQRKNRARARHPDGKPGQNRRVPILVVLTLCLAATALVALNLQRASRENTHAQSAAAAQPNSEQAGVANNRVRTENANSGTTAWQIPLPTAGAIEGYGSSVSAQPGTTLGLHVNTRPAAKYRVDVYRLGWYGGTGARLLDCLPSCAGERQGSTWPDPQPGPNGDLRAGWPVTDDVAIRPDWVSGYYIAKLVLTSGPQQGKAATVPFIVTAPPNRQAAILVQAAVNTWQAYNNWGEKSLYDFNSSNGVPAVRVSFDRPIVESRVLNYPFTWEYPLVRFLEREGFDVSYTTDVDVHHDPGELLKHRVVMTAGHDEYWTKEMRDGFDAALAAKVNLMFMGGNTANWQIRYDDSERTIIEYRSVSADPISDPTRKTTRFRELPTPRPECQLMGVQSRAGLSSPADPPRGYVPTPAATTDPWFADTGLSAITELNDLVGYEWDVVNPGCTSAAPTVLFHYEGAPSNADAVRFTAPSGGRVFSSGTLQFSWGLDDWGHPGHANAGLQQFMRNAIKDFAGLPPS